MNQTTLMLYVFKPLKRTSSLELIICESKYTDHAECFWLTKKDWFVL